MYTSVHNKINQVIVSIVTYIITYKALINISMIEFVRENTKLIKWISQKYIFIKKWNFF